MDFKEKKKNILLPWTRARQVQEPSYSIPKEIVSVLLPGNLNRFIPNQVG
jgi:hypothetical protein